MRSRKRTTSGEAREARCLFISLDPESVTVRMPSRGEGSVDERSRAPAPPERNSCLTEKMRFRGGMERKDRSYRPVGKRTSALAIFGLAGVQACWFFVAGCNRAPTTLDSSLTTPALASKAVLRAEPNPVPAGEGPGKTVISWDTGNGESGEVFVVNGDHEVLFGRAAQASLDAAWIQPGSWEFRLYSTKDHRLLTKLIVTRP